MLLPSLIRKSAEGGFSSILEASLRTFPIIVAPLLRYSESAGTYILSEKSKSLISAFVSMEGISLSFRS